MSTVFKHSLVSRCQLEFAVSQIGIFPFLVEFIDFATVIDSMYFRLLVLIFLAILAGMILDPLIPVLMPIILPTLLFYEVDLVHFEFGQSIRDTFAVPCQKRGAYAVGRAAET